MSSGHKSSVVLVSLLLLLSCVKNYVQPTETATDLLPQRIPITINLAAPWGSAEREYSGAAVYHDSVVLLPQYPDRTGNQIPMLPIKQLPVSEPEAAEYTAQIVRFDDDGLAAAIKGFEGFESIAFLGDDVFVTIESRQKAGMMGYLVRGKMLFTDSAPSIKLDAASRTVLPPRANLPNISDEAIVMLPNNRLLTLYEANGTNVVRNPGAYMFDISGDKIKRLPDVPIPNIEYRITDCAPADADGRFWCINFMYPGDEKKLKPGRDAFADPSQSSAQNARTKVVERLVELRFDGAKVIPTVNSPIYLKLRNDGLPRNWEGLAFVPGQGFFIVTDKYPETLFAFVRQ